MTELTVQDNSGQLAVVDSSASLLGMIATASRDPQVDVAKLRELLQMYREIQGDAAKVAYSRAMKAAQQEMPAVVRDAENAHTRSLYARLETIDAAIKPIYTSHGFSLTFNSPSSDSKAAKASCKVLHEDGHSEIHELSGDLDVAGAQGKSNKTSIQGLGSTMTYLRRYLTCMIFNVVLKNEDNDGNAAPLIDAKDFLKLTDLVNACEMNDDQESRFYKYMGVEIGRLDDIFKRDFPKAKAALDAQIRANQKGGSK